MDTKILPTFTFSTFKKNSLGVASHDLGFTDDNKDATDLLKELGGHGVEIITDEPLFFSDGEPPTGGSGRLQS